MSFLFGGGFSKGVLSSNLIAARHRITLHQQKRSNELERGKKEISALVSAHAPCRWAVPRVALQGAAPRVALQVAAPRVALQVGGAAAGKGRGEDGTCGGAAVPTARAPPARGARGRGRA